MPVILRHVNFCIDLKIIFYSVVCRLDKFTEWTDKWPVKLHVNKCKILYVSVS